MNLDPLREMKLQHNGAAFARSKVRKILDTTGARIGVLRLVRNVRSLFRLNV